MRLTDFLEDIGRPIAFYPRLTDITGSHVATILLSQFLYWRGKEKDSNGWLYKSQDEINDETRLTRHDQEEARKQLRRIHFLEEEVREMPGKMYFRLDLDAINDAWEGRQPSQTHGQPELLDDHVERTISIYARRLRELSQLGYKRALKHNIVAEYVDYETILRRDQSLCHYCGEVITRGPGQDSRSLQFDHVIGFIEGGTHTVENIHCSHAACNLSRAAKQKHAVRLLHATENSIGYRTTPTPDDPTVGVSSTPTSLVVGVVQPYTENTTETTTKPLTPFTTGARAREAKPAPRDASPQEGSLDPERAHTMVDTRLTGGNLTALFTPEVVSASSTTTATAIEIAPAGVVRPTLVAIEAAAQSITARRYFTSPGAFAAQLRTVLEGCGWVVHDAGPLLVVAPDRVAVSVCRQAPTQTALQRLARWEGDTCLVCYGRAKEALRQRDDGYWQVEVLGVESRRRVPPEAPRLTMSEAWQPSDETRQRLVEMGIAETLGHHLADEIAGYTRWYVGQSILAVQAESRLVNWLLRACRREFPAAWSRVKARLESPPGRPPGSEEPTRLSGHQEDPEPERRLSPEELAEVKAQIDATFHRSRASREALDDEAPIGFQGMPETEDDVRESTAYQSLQQRKKDLNKALLFGEIPEERLGEARQRLMEIEQAMKTMRGVS